MKSRKIALVAASLVAMSWAAPAYATSYGSSHDPVRIGSDGNGWFYGNVTVYEHQSMRNGYYYRDTSSDGHAVYVQTDWFYRYVENGSEDYRYSAEDQSPRIGSNDGTVHSTDYDDLESTSDRSRTYTKVCEDQSWSPDPCSKTVTISLGY